MAKSIPCVWFRHITATSFGSRSSRGQVDSQDGYRCEESIGREIFREDMGSPGGYPPPEKHDRLTPEGRKRLSDAMKKRWADKRAKKAARGRK